jgi:hypothetical protein
MADQVDELTFAEAFAALETRRPELEATLLARHPELQVEEEHLWMHKKRKHKTTFLVV